MNSWQSLFFYLACFALSALFVYLGSRTKTPQYSIRFFTRKLTFNVWATAGVLIPIVIGSLRYGMGIDYASYLEIYQFYADGGGVDWRVDYLQTIEPIFQWLAMLSYNLTNTPILFFGIPWATTILFVYFGIKRWTPRISRKFFAWAWFLILPIVAATGFNQTRQMLAVAILFFASHYIIKLSLKNILLYTSLAIVAVLCHRSAALIALVLLIIRMGTRNNGGKVSMPYLMVRILIISTLLASLIIVGIILSGTTAPYVGGFSRLLFINGSISGNIFGVADIRPENVILLCIFLPAVFLARFRNSSVNYVESRILSVFCFIGLLLVLGSLFVMNGERLAQYFVVFPIVVYYIAASSHINTRLKTYPIGMFFVIMLLGWQGVLPYYSIFDRDVDINAINSLSVRPLYNQTLCSVKAISCNDQIYFDEVVRERHEYKEGDLWKLER